MKRRNFLHHSAMMALSTPLISNAAELGYFDPQITDLSSHKIAEIAYTQVQLKWPRFVGKNARRDIHGYGPKVNVCVLTTDQGAKGCLLYTSRCV